MSLWLIKFHFQSSKISLGSFFTHSYFQALWCSCDGIQLLGKLQLILFYTFWPGQNDNHSIAIAFYVCLSVSTTENVLKSLGEMCRIGWKLYQQQLIKLGGYIVSWSGSRNLKKIELSWLQALTRLASFGLWKRLGLGRDLSSLSASYWHVLFVVSAAPLNSLVYYYILRSHWEKISWHTKQISVYFQWFIWVCPSCHELPVKAFNSLISWVFSSHFEWHNLTSRGLPE